MSRFWGVAAIEYRMSVRRWGRWVAMLLAGIPYSINLIDRSEMRAEELIYQQHNLLAVAGTVAWSLNFMMPVVGGIIMADRLARDSQLNVAELFHSTLLSNVEYVLGKYAGVVASVLTPVLVALGVVVVTLVAQGVSPLLALPAGMAFLAVNVPAYAFVGAFALACTAVLPVRIFQVLYTGYWFWGNYLNPNFIPTLSGTWLTPNGVIATTTIFQSEVLSRSGFYTLVDGWLSVVALTLSAGIALAALVRYLAWQQDRA